MKSIYALLLALVLVCSGCVIDKNLFGDFGIPDPTNCTSPCLDPTKSIRNNIASTEDLSNCEDIKSVRLREKDSCYASFALTSQELHYCGKIETSGERISCFSQFKESADYLDCGKIINQGHMNDCYNYFAVYYKDVTICQNIDNGHIGDCYIHFAKETNDEKICDRIMNIPYCRGYVGGDYPTDVCYKQNCYQSLKDLPLEKKYSAIWKELFIETNNLTEEFFDKNIYVEEQDIFNLADDMILRVKYLIFIDWWTFTETDVIPIKIFQESPYSNLVQPDVELEKEDIALLLSTGHWGNLTRVNNIEKLKYDSYEDAKAAFKEFLGEDINPARVSLSVVGKAPIIDGTPYFYLDGAAIVDKAKMQCMYGYFNLVTGEGDHWIYDCYKLNSQKLEKD